MFERDSDGPIPASDSSIANCRSAMSRHWRVISLYLAWTWGSATLAAARSHSPARCRHISARFPKLQSPTELSPDGKLIRASANGV
jgi:hypothetical protein